MTQVPAGRGNKHALNRLAEKGSEVLSVDSQQQVGLLPDRSLQDRAILFRKGWKFRGSACIPARKMPHDPDLLKQGLKGFHPVRT